MKRLPIALAAFVFFWGAAFAASPAEKQFLQDLAYYRKTSKAGNLNANDRLYILDRLRKKYAAAEFDLTDLYAEIDRWTAAKQRAPTVAAPAVPDRALSEVAAEAPADSARLVQAKATDTEQFSRLTLDCPGILEYKDVLNRDPKGSRPPVIAIYLYNTKEELKPAAKNFKISKGAIRQVQARSVTAKPPAVRVSVALSADLPYDTAIEGEKVVLTVHKKPPVPAAAAAVPAAAPTEVSPDEGEAEPPSDVEAPAVPALRSELPIEAGDVLDVRVSPTKEFSRQKGVLKDGAVALPLIGELAVAGLTADQAAVLVAKRLAPFTPNPDVNVAVFKSTGNQVYLAGEVKSPGAYPFANGLRGFELIARTGGFLATADKKNVMIYRGRDGKTEIFNAEAFAANPKRGDAALRAGDRIEVPKLLDWVWVGGSVKKPGRFAYQPGMKAMQAIYLAGGFGEKAADLVRVVRGAEGGKIAREIGREELLKDGAEKDVELQPGDLVMVPEARTAQSKKLLKTAAPWAAFFGSLALVLGLLL